MKIVCAWCQKDMGEKEPLEDTAITHSICDACQQKQINDIAKSLGKRKDNPCTTGVDGEVLPHVIDEIADGQLKRKKKKHTVKRRRKRR